MKDTIRRALIRLPGFLRVIIFVLILTFPYALSGQIADSRPDLKFHRIHEGLTSNQVEAIFQDSFGFIWVGTNSGLNRYDGIDFKSYHHSSESNTLTDNYINAIYEDRNQNLWFGSQNAMNRYRRATDDFKRYQLPVLPGKEDAPLYVVSSILEDEHGTLWVSGGANGLYYYDKESDHFVSIDNLETTSINSILEGSDNTLWLTSNTHGLIHFNTQTGNTTYFRHDPSDPYTLSSDDISEIVRDHDGTIWIGSGSTGISRVINSRDGDIRFRHYMNDGDEQNILGNNVIQTMLVDNDGNLWAGNDNGGLHLYDRDHDAFHIYMPEPDNPFSISHESINCLFHDRDGRLWIGTALTGLNVIDPYKNKFDHYKKSSVAGRGLNSDVVRAFLEDETGNIWIATDGGGLNYFNRQTNEFSAYMHNPEDPRSLQSNAILNFHRDNQNRIWVASYGGGLDLLVDKTEGIFKPIQEIYNIPAMAQAHAFDVVFSPATNYLWIASFGYGLIRYDQRTDESHRFAPFLNDENSLASDLINGLLLDSNGNLWVSSLAGLSKLPFEDKETGRFLRFLPDDNDPNSIGSLVIRHIMEDSSGNIWIATAYGLSRYDPEINGFHNYYESDGLPGNELRSIVEDDNGYLWIGTINGLSRFHPESGAFKNYTKEDGLQSNEFSRSSALKLSTGELLFGGMNGFNLFHPDDVQSNPHIPPVFITDFRLFNRPVVPGEEDSPLEKHVMVTDTITLSYDQNVITFDYVALNYSNAEQNRYAYMMEGFEANWNYVGAQRNATYTNLNPGTYHFRVKASNNDGIWNEEGVVLALVIVPPFWMTSWFYILVSLIVVGFVLAGFMIKVQQNKALENEVNNRTQELRRTNADLNKHITEKNKIYSVLAHDLRNPFSSIIGYTEYLQEKFKDENDQENREILTIIHNAAKNTHQLLENLLQWSNAKSNNLEINREKCDLAKLVAETINSVKVQAKLKDIKITNKTDGTFTVTVDRNMVASILRNLVTNAIKFSPKESEVIIHIREEGDRFVTSVTDSGVGISNEEVEKLFKSDGSIRKKGTMGERGTGFGLQICKEFAERNGGEINVESTLGEGSTFLFSLKKDGLADHSVNSDHSE